MNEPDNRPSFTETFRQHIKHGGMEADADISVTVRADSKDNAAKIHRELMKGVKGAAPVKFDEVETGPSAPCDTSERSSAPPVDSPYHCEDTIVDGNTVTRVFYAYDLNLPSAEDIKRFRETPVEPPKPGESLAEKLCNAPILSDKWSY